MAVSNQNPDSDRAEFLRPWCSSGVSALSTHQNGAIFGGSLTPGVADAAGKIENTKLFHKTKSNRTFSPRINRPDGRNENLFAEQQQ